MKKVRFRVWDIINKRIIKKPYLHFVDGESFFIKEKGEPIRSDLEFILLQFTGLKDKNGKEIYEGDVVKYITTERNVYEVRFANGKFVAFNRFMQHDLFFISKNAKVIGNIYQNSELLKENK